MTGEEVVETLAKEVERKISLQIPDPFDFHNNTPTKAFPPVIITGPSAGSPGAAIAISPALAGPKELILLGRPEA